MTAMMPEKGIDGITPDNDFINKLLSPEVKVDGTSKKGPAKAFLVQLAHKAETRCEGAFNGWELQTIPTQANTHSHGEHYC